MHQAVHPARRPQHPERRPSDRTVRVVPPSPPLSVANLQALNQSAESLSSVYSQRISGERRAGALQRPGGLKSSSRSSSSSSTATVRKSPLGIMRLASEPDIIVVERTNSRQSSISTVDSDIDDAATLQARLPSTRADCGVGEVSDGAAEGIISSRYYQRSYEICIGEMKRHYAIAQ